MSAKILIDFMNMVFINFNIAKSIAIEEKRKKGENPIFEKKDIPLFYHTLLKKFNYYFTTYGNLYICMEGYNSLDWRRSIFPDYKRNRDKSKGEDEYRILKETFPVVEQLMTLYPTKILKIDAAEADDIIYTLSEKYNPTDTITIISTDNDLSQILNKFENVKLYNPIKMKYIDKHPNILLEKAIIGDKSDNIPGLSRIGQKTFEKMLIDKSFFRERMSNGNKEIVETFLKIIDLSKIPISIKQEILDKDENTEYNVFNPDELEVFFFNNKLKDLLGSWGRIKNDILLSLKENK